jgi:hypothetical protein
MRCCLAVECCVLVSTLISAQYGRESTFVISWHLHRHFLNNIEIVCVVSVLLSLLLLAASCDRPITPGTSLEPTAIPTAQVSSFRLL